MFSSINVHNLLFLDIETVRKTYLYNELDKRTLETWLKKCKKIYPDANLDILSENNDIQKIYESDASFHPEYAKIICISCGYLDSNMDFKYKSFYDTDEKQLLKDFISASNKINRIPIAHNGFGFDFPFITKRCIINNLNPPKSLQVFNKKPWEVELLDTMEMWKGISKYGQLTSLDSLTNALNIDSPKTIMDGSQVADYYYNNKISDIVSYCENDIIALKEIILVFKNLE